jgi:dipeptidase E
MGKIIALGGGEIGRPGHPIETTKIDREIIRLSGKKHPRLLFFPTASGDAEEYIRTVKKHFGKRLGCVVDTLCLIKGKPSTGEIEKKISSTDIIYVGGGDTLRMMNRWRKLSVDKMLVKAYRRDIIMSGVSAGSICWFKWGNSDSRKFKNGRGKRAKVRGLGFIKALHCPHYDVEKERKSSLKDMMKKNYGVAIALENCCALEVVGDRYRIISSRRGKKGYKVFWSKGLYYETIIEGKSEFLHLASLLKKGAKGPGK